MIRLLTIRNFQCHKLLKLKLGKVTTIVGPTDAGKSAVLRAMRWVLLNEPRGHAFLRHGTERVSVTVSVDGKHKVKRAWSKQANTYHLDGHKFQAFGNDVPEEIATVLNVSHLNFQAQLDAPYWFSVAPGEVSRQLNAIVDLGVIDTTLAHLATALRKTRAEREVVAKRLESARQDKCELQDALTAHRALKKVERYEKQAAQKAARGAALRALVEGARKHQQRARSLARATSALEEVLDIGDVAKGAQRERDALHTLLREVRRAVKHAGTELPDLSGLEKLAKACERARERQEELANLLSNIDKLRKAVKHTEREHKDVHDQFYASMEERCPLCGGSMDLPF